VITRAAEGSRRAVSRLDHRELPSGREQLGEFGAQFVVVVDEEQGLGLSHGPEHAP
jgi:hypothetical protein